MQVTKVSPGQIVLHIRKFDPQLASVWTEAFELMREHYDPERTTLDTLYLVSHLNMWYVLMAHPIPANEAVYAYVLPADWCMVPLNCSQAFFEESAPVAALIIGQDYRLTCMLTPPTLLFQGDESSGPRAVSSPSTPVPTELNGKVVPLDTPVVCFEDCGHDFDKYLSSLSSKDRYTVRKSHKQGFSYRVIPQDRFMEKDHLSWALAQCDRWKTDGWQDTWSDYRYAIDQWLFGYAMQYFAPAFIMEVLHEGERVALSVAFIHNDVMVSGVFASTQKPFVGTYALSATVQHICEHMPWVKQFDPVVLRTFADDSYHLYKRSVCNTPRQLGLYWVEQAVSADAGCNGRAPYCFNGIWTLSTINKQEVTHNGAQTEVRAAGHVDIP